jgi:cytoskeletal protein RodZ
MDSQKPNNFEEEWQKAFNDASFAPPRDMWERIEQDLERKKRRPFLFFLRPSAMLAGVAATLILALGGILFFKQKDTPTSVANNTQTKVQPNSETQNQSTQPELNTTDDTSLTTKASNDVETINSLKIPSNQQLALAETDINKRVTKPKKSAQNSQLPALAAASFANPNAGDMAAGVPASNNQSLGSYNTQVPDNQTDRGFLATQNDNKTIVDLALLKHHQYQYLGSRYTLKREKLNFEVEETEAPIIASNDSKFWVGVQSGISPFDPNMKHYCNGTSRCLCKYVKYTFGWGFSLGW